MQLPLPQSFHFLIRKTIKISQQLFQGVARELSSRDTSECFYGCKFSSKHGVHENPCCGMGDGDRGGMWTDIILASRHPESRTYVYSHSSPRKQVQEQAEWLLIVFDSFGWLYNDKLSTVSYIIYSICNVYYIIGIILL